MSLLISSSSPRSLRILRTICLSCVAKVRVSAHSHRMLDHTLHNDYSPAEKNQTRSLLTLDVISISTACNNNDEVAIKTVDGDSNSNVAVPNSVKHVIMSYSHLLILLAILVSSFIKICHLHNISLLFLIRDLRRIRNTIDQTTAGTIATSPNHSKIDYCSSLPLNLPATQFTVHSHFIHANFYFILLVSVY